MHTGQRQGTISLSWCCLQPPPSPLTVPILSPLLYVAPQMPMLPCNSCLTMCPTKCCHPMEGRGSEEEGGFGWKGRVLNLDGRNRVINIHFFLYFSSQNGVVVVFITITFLVLPWILVYQYIIYLIALSLTQCFRFCLLLSVSHLQVSNRNLSMDSVEVMASAHVAPSPPLVTGSRMEKEGTSVRRCPPIGAAGERHP